MDGSLPESTSVMWGRKVTSKNRASPHHKNCCAPTQLYATSRSATTTKRGFMKVETAIQLLGEVTYKPGWEFQYTDFSNRIEGAVCVTMCCDTYASEKKHAILGYDKQIRPWASFRLIVDDATTNVDLYRQLMEKILEYEQHEAREFLRVKPTMWAPFNPHTRDGMNAWGNPAADMSYGMSN